MTPRCEEDCEDLRGAGGVLGGHWRRWRRALLGRSSSTPSTTADLGDLVAKFPQMEEVLQVYILYGGLSSLRLSLLTPLETDS